MQEEYERYKAAQAARWLEHVAQLGTRCATLQAAIEQERANAEGVRAVCFDGMPRAQSTGDALPNAVIRIQDAIRDFMTELAGYVEAQTDAHERITRMQDAACSGCLERHYVLGHPWERVCVDMGYSWQGMMSLRRRALAMAYEVMPTEWRDPMESAV